MQRKKIWMVLMDDSKGRFITRDPDSGSLYQFHCMTHDHPSDTEHGDDRPGRDFESMGGARHAYEPKTDWHTAQKEVFVKEVLEYLTKANSNHEFDEVYVFAPPKMIGFLRKDMPSHLASKITKEIHKDIVRYTLEELENYEF